ncbi:IS4 family transposase [uncultured Thiohalocapsa sp.]|uniref:IS4 family transposase n=1 Tax=uncultured Thiohalocapsa sp. TaxID=768990 RepID=UPI0025D806A6|nr:IS4 family transposase [uncultured Thiohalocapsa sp.]
MEQQKQIQRRTDETDSYAFFNVLTSARLFDAVEELLPEHRERLFPPTETLSMFLAQVLSADGSCQQAVDAAVIKRIFGGLPRCAASTSAYCQARGRLPTEMISELARQVGSMIGAGAPRWWHSWNRPVRLVDGATATMADTAENQAVYPQPSSQKPGLGFPICRMVTLICLGSGALLAAAIGPCEGKGSDEQTLLRSLLDALEVDDILLGDAFYPTYFLLCELVQRRVDGVFQQYGARKRSTDFKTGERLGARDHLVVLEKPSRRPEWMTPQEYAQAPATLKVREFAAGGKIMVTTFLDAKAAPKKKLKVLHQRRWNVELDLRNIKTTGAGRGVQKRLINDLLRMGLDRMEHQDSPEGPPFRTQTHRLGARVPSLDNVAEVLATSEAEDWR